MKVFVTRKPSTEAGEFCFDYIAERPAGGSFSTKYHLTQEKADAAARAHLRLNYCEVVIFDESFPA